MMNMKCVLISSEKIDYKGTLNIVFIEKRENQLFKSKNEYIKSL